MSDRTRPPKSQAPTPRAHTSWPALTRPVPPTGGHSLDGGMQARMSAQFGHDFSSVRIHTDSRAGDHADALGANAYALGSDIVFGEGHYQPGSSDTERLLAHELTHVVQQARGGPGDPARASRRGDASEREADALAADVAAGHSVSVEAAPQALVARDDDGTFIGPPAPYLGPYAPAPDPGVDPALVSSRAAAPTSYPGDTDAPIGPPAPDQSTTTPADDPGGIPQLSTPANDALGISLSIAGMLPGWPGRAATVASGVQNATQSTPNPSDPSYKDDQAIQDINYGLGAASLLGVEAAGPLGLVAAGGVAAGHGAQWLGGKMIEGGIDNNPGQFGPDPLDNFGQ